MNVFNSTFSWVCSLFLLASLFPLVSDWILTLNTELYLSYYPQLTNVNYLLYFSPILICNYHKQFHCRTDVLGDVSCLLHLTLSSCGSLLCSHTSHATLYTPISCLSKSFSSYVISLHITLSIETPSLLSQSSCWASMYLCVENGFVGSPGVETLPEQRP